MIPGDRSGVLRQADRKQGMLESPITAATGDRCPVRCAHPPLVGSQRTDAVRSFGIESEGIKVRQRLPGDTYVKPQQLARRLGCKDAG